MSEEIEVDRVIDFKGLACPMPMIKVSKGIKVVAVGEVLELMTTDPGELADFPAWARTIDNKILTTREGDGVVKFCIKRKV